MVFVDSIPTFTPAHARHTELTRLSINGYAV